MSPRLRGAWLIAVVLAAGARTSSAAAGGGPPDGAGELARKVANPLASLISVPVQVNGDGEIGPYDGSRTLVNVQPVVPIGLGASSRWRILSRTIVPVVSVDAGPWTGRISGLGDVTQSVFVTTVTPTPGGWTIGAGPVAQLPTGSDDHLTTDRWSLGPTAIAVRQAGPWTYGALANHLWSLGGGAGVRVSTTFVQPFVNYITPTHTTLAVNTEASRDWEAKTWSVPVHIMANQLLKVGPQPMSVFVGLRYWVDGGPQGPDGFGWRWGTTFLFPVARAPRQGGGS